MPAFVVESSGSGFEDLRAGSVVKDQEDVTIDQLDGQELAGGAGVVQEQAVGLLGFEHEGDLRVLADLQGVERGVGIHRVSEGDRPLGDGLPGRPNRGVYRGGRQNTNIQL